MKYPIGVQSFEDLRTNGCIYIDKTDLVYQLTHSYKYVFLGRPRRFGKSLLMSTIQAYFEGKRELFEGLAIEGLEKDWIRYPVLHFDLNTGDYAANGVAELTSVLNFQLKAYEKIYDGIDDTLSNRLQHLIREAYMQTGKKAVILIDEYDKPVLSTMGDDKKEEAIRDALKSFYGSLKTADPYIRFAMLTGVSKFGKLSVFSDLNNTKDISLKGTYASICGITKEEVLNTFSEQIDEFAEARGVSRERMLEDLRQKYDGYRFSHLKIHVYNPFSLFNALDDRMLRDYWFETGTPSYLVKLLRDNNYDLSHISGTEIDEDSIYRVDNISAIPLLYQTGYLTIKDYDPETLLCTLDYPNREVESAFLRFLLPYYSDGFRDDTVSEINKLKREITSDDVDAFMMRLKSIFYSIPYSTDNSSKVQEDQFRNITYLTFKLLGFNVQAECHMSRGRTDAVVQTTTNIYVFEFKVDSTPAEALAQIIKNGYAEPYRVDTRSVTLVGVNFSTAERSITGWEVLPRYNQTI